jgi:hypothetical protein
MTGGVGRMICTSGNHTEATVATELFAAPLGVFRHRPCFVRSSHTDLRECWDRLSSPTLLQGRVPTGARHAWGECQSLRTLYFTPTIPTWT